MGSIFQAFTRSPTRASLALGLLAILVGLIKYGIGVFPSWIYLFDISAHWQDPGQAPLMVPPADYLLANFPSAMIAGAAQVSSPSGFFGIGLVLSIVALLTPFAMPAIRANISVSRIAFIAIAGGAVLPVLLNWIGGYDALTVLGLGVGALSRNHMIRLLAWGLVAVNHPPMALIAIALWAPLAVVTSGSRRRRIAIVASAAIGVIFGSSANSLAVNRWGGATDRLTWFENIDYSSFWNSYLAGLPLVAFTSLGVLWFLLLQEEFRSEASSRLLMIEAIVTSLLLPLFTLDATRVVALSLFAAVLTWVASNRSEDTSGCRTMAWRRFGLVAAIAPVPVMWNGALVYAGWSSFSHLGTQLQPPAGYSIGS